MLLGPLVLNRGSVFALTDSAFLLGTGTGGGFGLTGSSLPAVSSTGSVGSEDKSSAVLISLVTCFSSFVTSDPGTIDFRIARGAGNAGGLSNFVIGFEIGGRGGTASLVGGDKPILRGDAPLDDVTGFDCGLDLAEAATAAAMDGLLAGDVLMDVEDGDFARAISRGAES